MPETEPFRFSFFTRYAGRWSVIVLLLFLAGLIAFREEILNGLGRYLVTCDHPAQGDVGFILGGGRSSRVDWAAYWWREGDVKKLLVSRTPGLADVDGVKILPEHEIVVAMLAKLGVPPDAIEVTEAVCPDTRAEAKALARYLQVHPQEKAVIITSEYHTRRCRWVFGRTLGADRGRILYKETAPFQEDWFRKRDKVVPYSLELIKLAAELVRAILPTG